MIVQGSLNYTTSGRKRRRIKRTKNTYEFKQIKPRKYNTRKTPEYPSVLPKSHATDKISVSKTSRVTVAIPYNKGPYQVIPESDIKYIGK